MAALVVDRYLQRLLDRHADLPPQPWRTYPETVPDEDARVFGISLVTIDGQSYEAGDTRVAFPIQSISKALTLALALDRLGAEEVGRHVDVEPTGIPFTSTALDPESGLPRNPMVNAGAIAVAGLVGDLDATLATYGAFAGRPLRRDDALWERELATNHRNRAIAHLLKASGVIEGDPEHALSLYLGQCTAHVDCRDLGVIAATLANGGVNPVTGVRAAGYETVRGVLSVMTSCGMYDDAGAWLFSVGMPAKSGVAGAIIAVLPGRFGLAVHSPPLDEHGNSIRGLAVCRDLSDDMALHMIESGRRGPSPVRARYTLRERTSKRVRPADAAERIAELGDQAIAFELQGELLFSEAEFVTREVVLNAAGRRHVVVDFRRIRAVPAPVARLFEDLQVQLAAMDVELLVSGLQRQPSLREALQAAPAFAELDLALEHAESVLLADEPQDLEPRRVPLPDHELLQGLDDAALETLRADLEPRSYPAGSVVLRHDDPLDELLLVISGDLSVVLETEDSPVRVGTLSAGMLVGELSLLAEGPRTSDVRADTRVEAFALSRERLEALRGTDPALAAAVLANLVRIVSRRAEALRDELALAGG